MILKGIPTKEAKAEIETHPVILEIAISKCSKLYKLYYASYSLTDFNLFLQLNDFLFHLFVSI